MARALTDTRSIRSDSPLQLTIDESDLTWRVLGTLNVFRLFVAIILLGLFFAGGDPRFFGERYPALFSATAAGYMVFAIVSGLAIRQRWVTAGPQILAQVKQAYLDNPEPSFVTNGPKTRREFLDLYRLTNGRP